MNASASVTLIDGFNSSGAQIFPSGGFTGARSATTGADAVGSTRIVYGQATGGSSIVTVGYSGTYQLGSSGAGDLKSSIVWDGTPSGAINTSVAEPIAYNLALDLSSQGEFVLTGVNSTTGLPNEKFEFQVLAYTDANNWSSTIIESYDASSLNASDLSFAFLSFTAGGGGSGVDWTNVGAIKLTFGFTGVGTFTAVADSFEARSVVTLPEITIPVVAVPEPSSIFFISLGSIALLSRRRRD